MDNIDVTHPPPFFTLFSNVKSHRVNRREPQSVGTIEVEIQCIASLRTLCGSLRYKKMQKTGGMGNLVIVPTLCVGMPLQTLRAESLINT